MTVRLPMPMKLRNLGRVGVGHVDRDGVAAGDGHGAGDAGGGEVVLGRGAGGGGVDADVAALDRGRGLHLLAAGAGGFGGDVVGALLGVDLSAEVDGEADEHHHHEAGRSTSQIEMEPRSSRERGRVIRAPSRCRSG